MEIIRQIIVFQYNTQKVVFVHAIHKKQKSSDSIFLLIYFFLSIKNIILNIVYFYFSLIYFFSSQGNLSLQSRNLIFKIHYLIFQSIGLFLCLGDSSF